MNSNPIKNILEKFNSGKISIQDAELLIKNNLSESLNFATIDHNRVYFKNFPEVIYAENKLHSEVIKIAEKIFEMSGKVLITRTNQKLNKELNSHFKNIDVNEISNMAFITEGSHKTIDKGLLVICAGTTDIPIAEEAAFTAEALGIKADRLFDVGVAGIGRLLSKLDIIKKSKIIITVAGMEGALPSVVSGLTPNPVIAVPTSIGYGSSINGLSALLSMLNSCSPGMGVVNIDNGFGAGYLASTILNTFTLDQ
jgi:NCAIR mutase (PurE)-related protein